MKKCILHLGFHKTGSTTFQQTCGASREILNQNGFFYPKFSYPAEKGNLWNHSGPLKMIYKRGHAEIPSKSIQKRERGKILHTNQTRLLKALKSDQDLLLSGEGLSCFSKLELERFIADLKSYGFAVEAFALVRPPYSFCCSAIQETFKSGSFNPLIGLAQHRAPSIVRNTSLKNRNRQIKTLQQVLGQQISFYPFSKAIAHPQGVVGFCLDCIGIKIKPETMIDPTRIHNTSLSNIQARVINQINQIVADDPNGKHCGKLQHRLIQQATAQLDSNPFRLTKEEFGLVEAEYNQVKTELATLLDDTFIEETLAFSSSEIDQTAVIQGLAQTAAVLAIQSRRDESSQT